MAIIKLLKKMASKHAIKWKGSVEIVWNFIRRPCMILFFPPDNKYSCQVPFDLCTTITSTWPVHRVTRDRHWQCPRSGGSPARQRRTAAKKFMAPPMKLATLAPRAGRAAREWAATPRRKTKHRTPRSFGVGGGVTYRTPRRCTTTTTMRPRTPLSCTACLIPPPPPPPTLGGGFPNSRAPPNYTSRPETRVRFAERRTPASPPSRRTWGRTTERSRTSATSAKNRSPRRPIWLHTYGRTAEKSRSVAACADEGSRRAPRWRRTCARIRETALTSAACVSKDLRTAPRSQSTTGRTRGRSRTTAKSARRVFHSRETWIVTCVLTEHSFQLQKRWKERPHNLNGAHTRIVISRYI